MGGGTREACEQQRCHLVTQFWSRGLTDAVGVGRETDCGGRDSEASSDSGRMVQAGRQAELLAGLWPRVAARCGHHAPLTVITLMRIFHNM